MNDKVLIEESCFAENYCILHNIEFPLVIGIGYTTRELGMTNIFTSVGRREVKGQSELLFVLLLHFPLILAF